MNRICCFVGALTFVASPALADVPVGAISNDRVTGYFSGTGGEFTFWGAGLSNAAYSPLARGIGSSSSSFQSFCVERQELVANANYGIISTTWADGSNTPQWGSGPASPQSHAVQGGMTGGGDDLNPQTAYLYTQFARGNLSGYDYTPGAGREGSAGDLQDLIWVLEGEFPMSHPLSPTEAGWLQDAVNATGLAFGTATPSGTPTFGATIGSVRILNTYADATLAVRGQDQLYLIPAPAALLLGVIGLGMVGAVKKRRA